MQAKVAIIGYGNMGSAISEQLKDKYQVSVFDKDLSKTSNLSTIYVSKSIKDLLNTADTIILAVKPQAFDTVLDEIKKLKADKLLISIAAGIPSSYIEEKLSKACVIRAMPNLAAKVAKGMICLSKGKYASGNDLKFTKDLFLNLGKTLEINENMMDAATAISGSGPGFLYAFLEARKKSQWQDFLEEEFIPKLSAAAGKVGFRQEEANVLASTTTSGSLALLHETGATPQDLRMQVASRGGTTEAGLKKLDANNIDSLEAATQAALLRAKKLSR